MTKQNTYYAQVTTDVAIKSNLPLEKIQSELSAKDLRADLTLINQNENIETETLLVSDVLIEDMNS